MRGSFTCHKLVPASPQTRHNAEKPVIIVCRSGSHSLLPDPNPLISMLLSLLQPVVLVAVSGLLVVSLVSGDDDDLLQINKLRKRLLKDQSYQRSSRPVLRHTTITNVSLTVFIRKIVGLDLNTGSLTTYGTLHMEWVDQHLTWSPTEFGGLSEMNFEFYEIWSPDIRSWSIIDGSLMSRSVGRDPLRVSSEGTVSWWTRTVIKSECDIDLTDFPFDQQTCSIILGSWTLDSTHLALTTNKMFDKQVYGPFNQNPEWAVIKKDVFGADTNISEIAAWHTLSIDLVLLRRNQMYKFRVGIPYFTAWSLAIFSFLSEVGSQRRLLFSSVSILIFLMIMVQLSQQLGPHSVQTPYAIKCLGMSLVVVTASLLVSSLIHVVSRKMTQSNVILPRSLTVVLESSILQTLLCLRESKEQPVRASDSRLLDARSSDLIAKEWQLMRQFVDRIFFLSFIVTAIFYHS